MTLDEAIKHAEEVVESCERGNPKKRSKFKCASEHRQLAEWLKELKALKAESCEDAISRKWVLDIVNYFVFDTETDRNRIIHIVRDTAPSVTSKQKTGEILTDYAIGIDKEGFERRVKETTYCSLCKWDLGYNGDLLIHYCPTCGVKLEYKGS